MEYNRIVAVTGLPGLYEVLSSKSDGAIVRSLDDKSTKFVSSRVHNLSHLESIEVYTVRENIPLSELFAAMKDSKTKLPDLKDNNSIKSYFEDVYPDLDFERVYTSDMKKMVKWFDVLNANEVDFTAKEEEQQEEDSTEPAEEPVAEKKPKAKAKAKTSTEEVATEEEKPKKPRKKKAE
jgi:hypothetical protein